MNFYLLGTGNMARFLGERLSQSGHTCAGLWGRDADKARRLAESLLVPQLPTLEAVADGPNACVLAVSDAALPEVAGRLALRETVLLHTAGSVPMGTLASAAPHHGVIWPVYSILAADLPVHRNFPCVWDASTPKAERIVTALAGSIGQSPYRAGDAARRRLHLAAVFGNNFTNHLLSICEALCAEEGLPFSLLRPLLLQTFERTATQAPRNVQTGPAKRGDGATVDAHKALLEAQPDWQRVYEALSASIAAMHRSE